MWNLCFCRVGVLAEETPQTDLCGHHMAHESCGYGEDASCGYVCPICPVQSRIDALPADITVQEGDNIVILSTCAYHTENGRFLIAGRQMQAILHS